MDEGARRAARAGSGRRYRPANGSKVPLTLSAHVARLHPTQPSHPRLLPSPSPHPHPTRMHRTHTRIQPDSVLRTPPHTPHACIAPIHRVSTHPRTHICAPSVLSATLFSRTHPRTHAPTHPRTHATAQHRPQPACDGCAPVACACRARGLSCVLVCCVLRYPVSHLTQHD